MGRERGDRGRKGKKEKVKQVKKEGGREERKESEWGGRETRAPGSNYPSLGRVFEDFIFEVITLPM